jgi:DNA-binding transcriptional ArsR family regulator
VSWQATEWARGQITKSVGRKALLLTLATYADEFGVCWPSQATLAENTEQSVDTVQRQLKKLQECGIIDRKRMPKRRGQWQGYRYYLRLQIEGQAKEQTGVRPNSLRSGHAATRTQTRPQSLRLKPSIEPSIEPSRANGFDIAAERQRAFQAKQEGSEIVQHRITRRIGDDGWLVLGEMSDAQRARLSTLERQRCLDDETLQSAVLAVRFVERKTP